MSVALWPLDRMRVVAGTLELRVLDDEHAAELIELRRAGELVAGGAPAIVPAGHWIGLTDKDDDAARARAAAQWHYAARGSAAPESWTLHLAVHDGGRFIGVLAVSAEQHIVTGQLTLCELIVCVGVAASTIQRAVEAMLGWAHHSLGSATCRASIPDADQVTLDVLVDAGFERDGRDLGVADGEPQPLIRMVAELGALAATRNRPPDVVGGAGVPALLGARIVGSAAS